MTAGRFDGGRVILPIAVALGAAVAYVSAVSPLAALVALGAVVLVLAVLTRPEWVLLLLLAALPWEGLLSYPTETLTVVKLLGLVLFVAVMLTVIGGRKTLYAPPTTVAVAVFVLLVAVSLIFSPDPGAGTTKLLRYVLFAIFFFLLIQLVEDRAGLLRALRVLTLSVTAAAVWGLVVFLGSRESRAGGPIGDPNDFAYLLATMLPLAGYLIVEDREWRGVWMLSFPLILAATLATLSRSALAALLALLIWAVGTRRINLGGVIASTSAVLVVLGVGLVLWGPLINDRIEQKQEVAGENTASREALWRGAVLMWMNDPLTGVGPGRYAAESVNYVRDNPIVLQTPSTHNSYLDILAESGPFALAAFLAFLGGSWLTLSAQRSAGDRMRDRERVRLATALQASLLVAIVGAFFLGEQLATPFWLIGALATVTPRVVGAGTRVPSRLGTFGTREIYGET